MKKDKFTYKTTKECVQDSCSRLSKLGNIESKSQFGGFGLCCDNTMFALVSEGQLYLRANNHELAVDFITEKMDKLVYRKRGLPVTLPYYLVDEILWQDETKLVAMAEKSLNEAKQDKKIKDIKRSQRLKTLPNLGIFLERLLWKAGITTPDDLKQQGALDAYLKIKKLKKDVGLNILFALEGAIQGCHIAALPEAQKLKLLKWLEEYAPEELKKYKQ